MAKKAAKKTVKATKSKAKSPQAKKAKAAPVAKKAAKKAVKKAVKKVAKKVVKKAVKKTAKKTAKKAAKKASPVRLVKKPVVKVNLTEGKRLTKTPLTKPQLKVFKQMLIEKRVDLIGDMTGIRAEALGNSGDLSNMPTHPADVGTDNFEQEFTLGLLESERALLTELEEALQRMADGTYGICVGTGQAIGLPRLQARPWAKYSIEYARLLEKGLVTPLDQDSIDEEDK